jgi:hypothetical protein
MHVKRKKIIHQKMSIIWTFEIKVHEAKMYLYKATNKRPIHGFQLQKSNILYLENICYNFYANVFFTQVENFNSITNSA